MYYKAYTNTEVFTFANDRIHEVPTAEILVGALDFKMGPTYTDLSEETSCRTLANVIKDKDYVDTKRYFEHPNSFRYRHDLKMKERKNWKQKDFTLLYFGDIMNDPDF